MSTFIKARLTKWLGQDHALLHRYSGLKRSILRYDARLSRDYLSRAPEPKLQIGGGWSVKSGWLNTDVARFPSVLQMDATKPFPFPNDAFQFIFCEHMIEHVSSEAGVGMLSECYRVLRPSGVIRMVTPDLAAILGLYDRSSDPRQEAYLSFFSTVHLHKGKKVNAAAVINGQFRLWGHQFIYDELTLREVMSDAGFNNLTRKRLGESEHSQFKGIENERRYPPGLLDFESLALEGCK